MNLKRKSGLDGMIKGCDRNGSLKEEIGEKTFHLNLNDIEVKTAMAIRLASHNNDP